MSESIQKVLTRLRRPRVQITYDVAIGNAIVKKELPFIIGIISDLSGDTELPKIVDKKFIYIDPDNFTDIMQSYNPTLTYAVKDCINPAEEGADPKEISVSLTFKSMDDFLPDNIIEQVPELKEIYDKRVQLVNLLAVLDGNSALDEVLHQIVTDDGVKKAVAGADEAKINELIDQGRMVKTDEQRELASSMLTMFAEFVGEETEINSIHKFLMQGIEAKDEILSNQMDAILHNDKFQVLEARWKGIFYLIYNIEMSESLKVRLLSTTKKELGDDLNKAISFDQSQIFKKIYEEEFDTFGGTPYSCIIADFADFDRSAPTMDVLEKLTTVCAAAHAPLLTSADPSLFNWEDYTSLAKPRDLKKIFASVELARWNGFRDTEDSRYCSMFLPKVLMRVPYDVVNNPIAKFAYTETVNGATNADFCWGNTAYAMGVKIGQAYAKYQWVANIRGVEGGGLVEGLPVYTYKTAEGDILMKCPTEVTITDRREKELSDLGFIAICHAKGKNYATFFGGQTVQKPVSYNTPAANANAELSARLPYILNASRFAHYIKIMMRDKIGSMVSKDEIQAYIQTWLSDYILLSDNASQALKAATPLRNGSVTVTDIPGKPGCYNAILELQPHFQLEELSASIRLVAQLGAA